MSKLKDLSINITDGEHGTVKDDIDGEYFLLSNKNIVDGNIVIGKNERKINKVTFDKINKRTKLEVGDVVISTVGTIGKTAVIEDNNINYVFQRSVGIIKVDKNKLNPYYLKYQLDSEEFQKRMIKLSKGAIQKCLYISDLEELEIKTVELEEQNKIANKLKSIDDKIKNNIKIINELEQMIKTIYDYWFLQFDFPNKDGKPYKFNAGKMIWNESLKREIPCEWNVKRIVDIENNIITGKTPSTKDEENFNGDIPFITIDDIRKGLYVSNTIRTLSEKGANSQIKKYIPEDAICVTCIATVGLIGIATKKSQTNQQINSIVCKNKNNIYYLINALNNYFKYSSGAKSGNIFDNMNKDDFSSIELVYPTENILKLFTQKVEPAYYKIKSCILENEELINLKEFLLPLLINNQITIKKDS